MATLPAPDPVHTAALNDDNNVVSISPGDKRNHSAVKVTIVGCGGCGMNLARHFDNDDVDAQVLRFDTSLTNARFQEKVYIITDGSGSGSHRSQNAREIEKVVTDLPAEEMENPDVAIVMFSLAGGSGSVIGPLMAREYKRRGVRVVCVVVADTSSTIGAKNTINTLKTLTAIAKNADLYLPLVLVSNDQQRGRRGADEAALQITSDLVEILTAGVFEVDRNDRLNFIDPSKVIGANPGLKILRMVSDKTPSDPEIVIGLDSSEMVDSLLITQTADTAELESVVLPRTRLKKVGFYYKDHRPLIGHVTGDITRIDSIIDTVIQVQDLDKAQRYGTVDRLTTDGRDELIL